LLDRHPEAWPWAYAVGGLAAAYGYTHWSRLRRSRPPPPPVGLVEAGSPLQALLRDRTFLAFEACFMVYGIGFLALQPVLPIFLVDELHVSYSQVGAARGFAFWLAFMLSGPVTGRLADRFGILRVGASCYALLAGFPLLLLALPTQGPALLYPAFALYGLAMGGVNLAWNLGPIVLARGGDPLPYLNAHVALVGVRALIGMVGGTVLLGAVGSRPVFWLVVVCELLACAGMFTTAWLSGRRWTRPV